MSLRHVVQIVAALAMSSSLAACSFQKDDAQQLAEDVAAITSSTSRTVGLSHAALLAPYGTEAAVSPTAAAEALAGAGNAAWSPMGCLSKAQDGASVAIGFGGCEGPFGLTGVRGGLDVTFGSEGGELTVGLAGLKGLEADGLPVDYTASARIALGMATTDVELHASWLAALPEEGPEVSYDADIALGADAEGCIDLSGTGTGAVDGREVEFEVDGYRVCPLQCPAAGTVRAESPTTGARIRIDFDGSPQARLEGDSGVVLEIPLECGAE